MLAVRLFYLFLVYFQPRESCKSLTPDLMTIICKLNTEGHPITEFLFIFSKGMTSLFFGVKQAELVTAVKSTLLKNLVVAHSMVLVDPILYNNVEPYLPLQPINPDPHQPTFSALRVE